MSNKERLNITVDSEVVKLARDQHLNISAVTEASLREKLLLDNVDIPNSESCEYCGKDEKMATKTNDGLVWIYPYSKWMCPTCWHKNKSRNIL